MVHTAERVASRSMRARFIVPFHTYAYKNGTYKLG